MEGFAIGSLVLGFERLVGFMGMWAAGSMCGGLAWAWREGLACRLAYQRTRSSSLQCFALQFALHRSTTTFPGLEAQRCSNFLEDNEQAQGKRDCYKIIKYGLEFRLGMVNLQEY
jgi:hypothetical protein